MTIQGQVGEWNGKSIPTFYAGTTFRSRTEARWAVFFDHLNARWFYEYEGFEAENGSRYLPYFWLPEQRAFIEVKPEDTDPFSVQPKSNALPDSKRLIVVCGAPGENLSIHWQNTFYPATVAGGTIVTPFGDGPYLFCFCPRCGKLGIEFDGRGARVCRHDPTDDKSYSGDDARIAAACETAKNWRFA